MKRALLVLALALLAMPANVATAQGSSRTGRVTATCAGLAAQRCPPARPNVKKARVAVRLVVDLFAQMLGAGHKRSSHVTGCHRASGLVRCNATASTAAQHCRLTVIARPSADGFLVHFPSVRCVAT